MPPLYRGGGSGGSVEGALPWQGSGRAMAVAVQGSMEGEALVDGDTQMSMPPAPMRAVTS